MIIRILYLFCLFCLPLHSTCADTTPIKLGYVTDLSGKGAFLGLQSQFGAQLAVHELVQQGVKIEILFGDSKLETRTALTEATRLVNVEKVHALLSDHTPISVAISSLAAQAKILFLYQSPAASILEVNPYSFRNFLDYEQGCQRIAKRWQERGIKKIAHLKINFEFGELCLRGSLKIFPSQKVIDYNSGDDLRSILISLKAQGYEALFQTAYEIDMLNRLQASNELQYYPLSGVPEPLLTKLVVDKGGRALKGTLSFGFPKISADFIAKVRQRDAAHAMENIESAAIAYMQVYQLAAVLKRCPLRDIICQRESLAQAAPDPILGFEGWRDRKAQYQYSLREL